MTRHDELVVRIDGERPLSAETVAVVCAACDAAEDASRDARDARDASSDAHVTVHVSGAPGPAWASELTVGLVSKWERVLRRLERLPVATVAVATGDCGGPALDALLATDYRIAATSARLLLPVSGGGTWPGMALYRLARHACNATAIRRAVLFGLPLDASDALASHLVHEVTDDVPGALARAGGLATAIRGTELAVRRQLMFDATTVSFEDALGAHLAACDRALRRASAWPAT